jgi:hypothetical protein
MADVCTKFMVLGRSWKLFGRFNGELCEKAEAPR